MLQRTNLYKHCMHHAKKTHTYTLPGLLLIACFLLSSLAACTNGQGSSVLGGINGNPTKSASGSSGTSSTPTSTTSTGTTPTVSANGATPINATITYASVDITVVDVKQAKSFADETIPSTSDVLRVDLKENNVSDNTSYNNYDYVTRLILPDGSQAEPLSTQNTDALDASLARTNWIDFPVPLSVAASQVSLQFGKTTEAQEVVPLKAGADVSKYAAKSSTPNVTMTYGQTDWTVTKATRELSYKDTQAGTGMMYVVVDLNANNKGSSDSGDDLIPVRLKAGSTMNPSQDFLNRVAAEQTNVKSTVSFIMPQGSTNFTLIFLPSSTYGITTQSTVNFQIA
jgi:hypothetical protein